MNCLQVLIVLIDSEFLEHCIESMEFCAVFELLCTLVNCLPDAAYRDKVKEVGYFDSSEYIVDGLYLKK